MKLSGLSNYIAGVYIFSLAVHFVQRYLKSLYRENQAWHSSDHVKIYEREDKWNMPVVKRCILTLIWGRNLKSYLIINPYIYPRYKRPSLPGKQNSRHLQRTKPNRDTKGPLIGAAGTWFELQQTGNFCGHAFSFYLKLKILRLDNNPINNILNTAFDGLSKLRVLNISCNRIGNNSIQGGAFRGIAQLEVLAIQHNDYTNYSKIHIALLTRLRHLQADIFRNFEFDHSFLAFSYLKILNLNPRTPILLQNNRFSGLNNSQIENLDLSFHVLRLIGFDFLRPFHHLQSIWLRFVIRGSGIHDVLRSLNGLSNRNNPV